MERTKSQNSNENPQKKENFSMKQKRTRSIGPKFQLKANEPPSPRHWWRRQNFEIDGFRRILMSHSTWVSFDLRRLMVPPLITPFMSQQLFVCVDVDVMPRWWLLPVFCRSWHWFTFPLWIDNGWWWCNFFGDNCYNKYNFNFSYELH